MAARLRVFLACLVLAACDDADGAGTESAPPLGPLGFVVIDSQDRAQLLTPGQSVELRARVENEDGTPVPGARVYFLAPDFGPSGTFGGATLAADVLSDETGVVLTTFEAGDRTGAFFVSAYQLDGPGRAHFAVSVSDDALAAASGKPAAIDYANAFAQPGDDPTHASPDVLGPLFLPAGTTLRDGRAPGSPIENWSGPGWLTWVVPSLTAKLGAPSDIALTDGKLDSAVACGPSFLSHRTESVPVARRDAEEWSLAPPMVANRTVLPALADAPAFDSTCEACTPGSSSTSEALRVPLRPLAEPATRKGECAILVRGSADGFRDSFIFNRDIARARRFFADRRRVETLLEQRSFGNGEATTEQDLREMLATASASCTAVSLYLGGHANGEASSPAPNFFFGDTPATGTNHRKIATWVKDAFAGKGTDLTLIIDSCHAERAVQEYQGLGLSGRFILATLNGQTSETATFGSIFTTAFFDWWSKDPDLNPAQVVDDLMADVYSKCACIVHGRSHNILSLAMTPTHVPIRAEVTDWNQGSDKPRTPDVHVALSSGDPISTTDAYIERPVDAMLTRPGAGMGKIDVKVTFDAPALVRLEATIDEADGSYSFALDQKTRGFTLPFVGLNDGTTRYRVRTRAWHHAFEGSGLLVIGAGKCPSLTEPCPEPAAACDRRVPISEVAAFELGLGTFHDVGLPSINDRGDVLGWGADGSAGYSLLGLGTTQAAPGQMAFFGPVTGAHDLLPVLFEGKLTTLITRPGFPRVLSEDRSFPFPADIMVGPSVDEQGAFVWKDGAIWLLGKNTRKDPLRRLADNVRSNGTGTFAWAVGDLTQGDNGGQKEIHSAQLGKTCGTKLIATDEPLPTDASRNVTFVQLWGIDPKGRVIVEVRHRVPGAPPGDSSTEQSAVFAVENGDFFPLLQSGTAILGGAIVEQVRVRKSDPPSGTVLASFETGPGAAVLGPEVLLQTTGERRILPYYDTPPAGIDPADANEMTLHRYFVGDERVALTASLTQTDSASPNYGVRPSALFVERHGGNELWLAIREGAPAPCSPGMVWSDVTLPETAVYFAGADRAYLKAAIRPASGSGDGSYGLWLLDGADIVPVFRQGSVVDLGATQRTVSVFGRKPFDSEDSAEMAPDSARTNAHGQLVLDVAFAAAPPAEEGRAIWVISSR